MYYFAVQVWTGHEHDYIKQHQLEADFTKNFNIYIPSRRLNIRKMGKTKSVEKPVFPGYVFLEHEHAELDRKLRWLLRTGSYFVRLLPDTKTPKPLAEKDRILLSHFISVHRVADTSKVYFDENDRIVVLEGPLKGLEGNIIKVNRRKCRVKVMLDMCGSAFTLDLGYEFVERKDKGKTVDHAENGT
ncbi:MAG: antiterminator LoaP [Spirochaetes bacterium]|nr:antiterminator LoaP [Spirochaetota bacterium]MBU0954374.1 antiterminator LoaP [Spirochaetota bacterium]